MYRWVDHTGELELEIYAEDERGVFEDAVAALRELLEDGDCEPDDVREVRAVAADRATLLAEYLSELLFRVETQGFVPVRLGRLELDGGALSASVHGYHGNPPHLVKAVTYHRLTFDRSGDGWRATVVLDV